MQDREKSDGPVVPVLLSNNARGGAAEAVEGSGSAKGNTASKTRSGHGAGQSAPNELDRVRRVAATDKEARFTALLHHVDVDRLRAAYWAIEPKAAPGVDGVTWEDYGLDLEANLRICTLGFTGARTGRAVAEGVHPEIGRAAAAARGRPGRPGTLLCPAPLRTVRAGFPAHGSSKP